ncbi:MAG: hypothetical protein AB7Q17_03480 [Phycisphaerae bacterium]
MDSTTVSRGLLARLYRLGDPRGPDGCGADRWRDYRAMGLTDADVPTLCSVVTDHDLFRDPPTTDGWFAAVHAWRALAQVGAPALIELLVAELRFRLHEQDDWLAEDFPRIAAELGPATVPVLRAAVADSSEDADLRIIAASALAQVAERHAEVRGEVVAVLTTALAAFDSNPVDVNAFLIDNLLTLRAVESAETIERAYAAGRVDEGVVGGWDAVRDTLGVKELGLRTADSPSNPNSLLAIQARLRAGILGAFRTAQNEGRRERRNRKRRRRR